MSSESFSSYLQAPLTESERQELENNREKYENSHSFAGEPSFGTGGMRATVAQGTNHLNRYNIGRLSLALARVLKAENADPLVVIGYDSRLSSVEFSRISYFILREEGVRAKVFKQPTPTPLISFGVRELGATAGVVITASHNPPEYNGYKVYGNDGAQIVPPVDKQIQDAFLALPYSELKASLHEFAETPVPEEDIIEEEIYQAYMERLKKEVFVTSAPKDLKILYSPLHGTGGWIFERAFADLGFRNFSVLAAQKQPDGHFPTVKSPNPEETESFTLLIEEGKKTGADLLIATDPDADRVGVAVKSGDSYILLNGNQAGSLLIESIARKKASTLKDPYVCKTIVTTELQRRIGERYNARTVETLTGFKYIAEVVGRDPQNYLAGGEESYGYLPVDWVRDKDSLSSAVALAELAAVQSLPEALDEIYVREGLYLETLYNIKLSAEDPSQMEAIRDKLKNPRELLGDKVGARKVADILDLQKSGAQPTTAYAAELKANLAEGLVVQYWLEPEGRLTIRPSGTEPKVKIYLSLRHAGEIEQATLADAKEELKREIDEILQEFLQRLGVK